MEFKEVILWFFIGCTAGVLLGGWLIPGDRYQFGKVKIKGDGNQVEYEPELESKEKGKILTKIFKRGKVRKIKTGQKGRGI